MKREKLGELFLKAKLISRDQLAHVLTENRKHPGEKLGQTLVRLKLASDTDIARALSLQSNIPYIDLNTVVIDPYAVKRIPLDLAMKHHLLPIYIEKNNLVLAMETPQDFEALEAARFASGFNIRPHVATSSEIVAGIKRYYTIEESIGAAIKDVEQDEDLEFIRQLVTPGDQQLEELKKQSESPQIEKMVNTIIFQGVAVRASAIQIDPQQQEVIVRNRVDGVLVESMKTPKWTQGAIISRLKIMAGMDFTKRMIPQKGRTQFKMHQRVIELEMSCLPSQHGENMIIKILDTGETIPLINDLGLLPDDLTKIQKLLWLPHGLTIVCGPRGSGKTTTLYAMAHELARHQRKVITVEERLEYQLKGVQQVQINVQAGLTFAQALQSVLKHNPDVMLVGELQDKETAEIAMHAAKKGRVVLSVVRTDDLITTIIHLKELGVDPRLFAASLSGVITQRLVRKMCSKCQESYQPAPQLLKKIEAHLGEKIAGTFQHGKGCQACNYTGYQDRIGIYNVVLMSEGLRRLIMQDTSKPGAGSGISKTERTLLMKNTLENVKQGLTTLEETERVLFETEEPDKSLLLKCEHCHQPVKPDSQVCPSCQQPLRTSAATGIEQIQEPAQIASPKDDQEDGYPFKGCKILVVEPDQHAKQQLQSVLLKKHFMVMTATNGEEAWEHIAREKPHLVLTEVVMPKLDGLELLKRLRKDIKTTFIPVIVVSEKGETADRIKGFAAGTDDYVPKPFSMHELLFRINAILRRTYKS